LQLFAVYIPLLVRILGMVRPTEIDWLVVLLCSVAPILIVETTKVVVRWKTPTIDGQQWKPEVRGV